MPDTAWLEVQVKDLEADLAGARAIIAEQARTITSLKAAVATLERKVNRALVALGGVPRPNRAAQAGRRLAEHRRPAKLTTSERSVLEVLDGECMDLATIASGAGMTVDRTRVALASLVEAGVVIRNRRLLNYRLA